MHASRSHRLLRGFTLLVALGLLGQGCADDTANDEGSDVVASEDADAAPDVSDVSDVSDVQDATGTDADADASAGPGTGEGVFARGCPAPDAAVARELIGDEALTGPNALGGAGDFLLANTHAAYVIQGVYEPRRTYWYYGGQPIDAAPVSGCEQAAPERFDEMGVILGTLDLGAFEQSVLRGFRAERVEVVETSDGSAHIRATGTDDFFWLIELELVRRAFSAGSPRGLSEPMGIEVVVDYVLPADSPALRMEVTVRNVADRSVSVVAGLVNFFADTTRGTFYNEDRLAFGGLNLALGIPWLVSFAPDYGLAVAMRNAQAGTINIAGVDALVNVTQFLEGARLRPAGADGAERTDTYFVSVGTSANAAVVPFLDVLEEALPGVGWSLAPTRFEVRAAPDERAVAGAEIVVERQNLDGDWSAVDTLRTNADGQFEGGIVALDGTREHRARAFAEGRGTSAPVRFTPGQADPVQLALADTATITIAVTDDTGAAMPAKVLLWQAGQIVDRAYVGPFALELPVAAGSYELTVSRGFEYEVYDAPLVVEGGVDASLEIALARVVDTSGSLSMDGHVHAGPSPDSPIPVPVRALTLAAENVEVAVSTDHEAILPWAPVFEELGLTPWVRTVLGEEVTPPLPEHSNAYPFPDRSDEAARGVQVDWFGKDIAGVFAASRERGAQVVALNHPRNGCNYMCLIGYDRITGEPTLEDPTLLAFEPNATLWSWDFDTVEYLNGHRDVFVDPAAPNETGTFDDWMSFLNHGQRITATGVTDVHGLDAQGSPRTYFLAPTDAPAEFEDQMLVDAMLGGRAQVSTGAFARVSIEGASFGDTVQVPGGEVALNVRIDALPEINVSQVQVFANCDQVALLDATAPDAVTKFDDTIAFTLEADAHVVVVAHGEGLLPRPFPQFDPRGVPRVTTNPIYVDVDGDGLWTAPGGRACTYDRPFDGKSHLHGPIQIPEAVGSDALYANDAGAHACPCSAGHVHEEH